MFDFFVPCPRGLEAELATELEEIKAKALPDVELLVKQVVPGGVMFSGSYNSGCAVNLYSRLASRVLMRIATGRYSSETDIYELALKQQWENWFSPHQTLRVDVTAIQSALKSINFITLRIKDAICDRLREKTGQRPTVNTETPDIRVFAFLNNHEAILYLDTSGEPLFKRGWRLDKGAAPLREILAAGLLRLSGWKEASVPLYDPMCGSGTLLIEAAQLFLDIAPGIHREFGFEKLKRFDKKQWQAMRQTALAQQKTKFMGGDLPIYGSDISTQMLDKAAANMARAGITGISLKQVDVRDMVAPCTHAGFIVTNPPYGERIQVRGLDKPLRDMAADYASKKHAGPHNHHSDRFRPSQKNSQESFDASSTFTRSEPNPVDEVFFQALGTALKQRFVGWTAQILSADLNLPSLLRLKTTRRIPLFNGPLDCRLFRFDMQAGSLRRIKEEKPQEKPNEDEPMNQAVTEPTPQMQ